MSDPAWFSQRQHGQQQQNTYGRRAHKISHWQGLTDTDLWSRTSPVKRVLPMFSNTAVPTTTADSHGDDGAEKKTAATATLRKKKSSGSLLKLATTLVGSDKENNSVQPLSTALIAQKIKRAFTGDDGAKEKPASPEKRAPLATRQENDSIRVSSEKFPSSSPPSSADSLAPPSSPPIEPLPVVTRPGSVMRKDSYARCAPPVPLSALCTTTGHEDDGILRYDVPTIVCDPSPARSLHSSSSSSSSPSSGSSTRSNSRSPPQQLGTLSLTPTPTPRRRLVVYTDTPQKAPDSYSSLRATAAAVGAASAPLPSSPLREVTNIWELDRDSLNAMEDDVNEVLRYCGAGKSVQDFTQFVKGLALQERTLTKLGEASYSEIFCSVARGNGETRVLKVLPFGGPPTEDDVEQQASARDIANELQITSNMSSLPGFVHMLDAHVVRGVYPTELLALWDAYADTKGSENVRPDWYSPTQLYAVVELQHGGADLEHFEVRSWRECAEVFWQVAHALAGAEEKCEFEHRDLHWGNIVLRRVSAERIGGDELEDMMSTLEIADDKVQATIIDFTLSRARCGQQLVYTNMDDPALYTGRGDYQFEIYRLLRAQFSQLDRSVVLTDDGVPLAKRNARRRSLRPVAKFKWDAYRPRTNVLWLHYLVERLLNHKHLRVPRRAGARGGDGGSAAGEEIRAYKSLEAVLRTADPRGRRGGAAEKTLLGSAVELMRWAQREGIVIV
ncbi:uncharacterized protein V1518DRAFT_372268 [Limtongia smithiae]|uniref:uncharacterized protein n=1 Tax=Limtongia smithiae TaxID=1125753 RepID=UPI0034CFD63B